MALKICVLASGSSGNCTYVASDNVAILIDGGLSCRETARRLESIGADLSAVRAVCVTHEHDDHKASLGVLQRRINLDLYANAATAEVLQRNEKLGDLSWKIFSTGSPFDIGDLRVEPFSVPHDAYDPVGFVVRSGDSRAGIVTDMGMATELIRERLRKCQALVIESNHDEQLLKDAKRPWPLKQRIAGRQGHMSNEQAGQLLADIAGQDLAVVFLAHVSADCNRPDLAAKCARNALAQCGYGNVIVNVARADCVSEVVNV